MKRPLRSVIKYSWLYYKAMAIVCFTGLMLVLGFLYFDIQRFFSDVELPNGVRLTQSLLHNVGRNGFVLRDQNNRFVLAAKNAEIAWQGNYVFGTASSVISGDEEGDNFIYKRGWEKPIIYDYNTDVERQDNFEKYGLIGSIDYDPETLFQGSEYEECLEKNGASECKFGLLEQYRQDVEDGKKQPYHCGEQKTSKKCLSYSKYKTYLSLVRMKKHHRNWKE